MSEINQLAPGRKKDRSLHAIGGEERTGFAQRDREIADATKAGLLREHDEGVAKFGREFDEARRSIRSANVTDEL